MASAWTVEEIPDQSGKVAIVTGANSGIGYEAALVLAGKGAQVVLACRNAEKAADAKVRVVVWDEQQPAQRQAYPKFLGNYIADYLKRQPGLQVHSVSIDHPQKGLSDEVLDDCDVLIWWGHVRNRDIFLVAYCWPPADTEPNFIPAEDHLLTARRHADSPSGRNNHTFQFVAIRVLSRQPRSLPLVAT